MSKPGIMAIGTANPELYMSQEEVYEFYTENDLLPRGQKELYAKLLLEGTIKGRHFGLDHPAGILNEDADAQIARFSESGRKVGKAACLDALAKAKMVPEDIGGLVVNTCTGYLCPGLTSYLVEDVGFRNDIKVVDIAGMGCGSAIPNLESAAGMRDRTRGKPVMSVAVEICSATHYMEDAPGITVSNCIFGDGAAAAIVDAAGCAGKKIELLDFETGIFPKYRESLRYTTRNGRLRNVLTRQVPVIGATCLRKVVDKILARNSLEIEQIDWWAVHAGGTEVLTQVAKKLELEPAKLEVSLETFQRYGNMSSPTVLFALSEQMDRGATVGKGLLLAFGAGFTAFAALASGTEQ